MPVGDNIPIGQFTGHQHNPIHGQKPEGVAGCRYNTDNNEFEDTEAMTGA